MTIYEIVYAIKDKLNDRSDDTNYSDDYLLFQVNIKRNVLLRREYNQINRVIDSDLLYTVCMELEHVNPSECPDCFPSDECEVVRTKLKLPKLLELHNRTTVTRVAPVDMHTKPFSLISRHKAAYVGKDPWEKNTIYAYLSNEHLYLKSINPFYKTLDYIAVTLLPENPLDLNVYRCDTGDCYKPETEQYPIKGWMADVLINMIVEELANLKQIPEDRTNNAKADV